MNPHSVIEVSEEGRKHTGGAGGAASLVASVLH